MFAFKNSKWKSDMEGALVCFTYSLPQGFIFCLDQCCYFPQGFTRPHSFISTENCFPGFQSLAARYDKTQYQEHLCFLFAILSRHK